MTELAISGTGVFTPAQTITNDELVASFNEYVRRFNDAHAKAIAAGSMTPLLESSSDFIVKASGIKRRYVLDRQGILDPDIMCPRIPERPDDQISVMAEIAVAAARGALRDADRKPADIGGVIVSCANLQRAYPAVAIEVQDALGIEGFGFDMNVGCSSATYALQVACGMIERNHLSSILICNPEILTAHVNFRDRDSHFIFGDAASAFIVERASTVRSRNCWEVVSTSLKSKFSNNIRNNFGFLNRTAPEGIGNRDKLFVQQGRKVFREVVPLVSDFIHEHLEGNGLTPQSLKRMWLHQANLSMNQLIAHRVLGRDATATEAPITLDEYANTSSAGAMIAFNRHSADLNPGDYGLLCTFGAGYSAGSVILRKMAS
ncbi:MAG: beta-ketoacyl-ACP synthase III [Alphaproteobacteria bacterium]|nr:beta-ketoacyl-ACP synthase III [Alphaproteobacteria bacterium]